MCFDVDSNIPGFGVISVHDCPRIKTDCSAPYKWSLTSPDGQVFEGENNSTEDPESQGGFNCTEFNAFRAFFVMSIIFTGAAIIAMLFYVINATVAAVKSRRWFIATVSLILI